MNPDERLLSEAALPPLSFEDRQTLAEVREHVIAVQRERRRRTHQVAAGTALAAAAMVAAVVLSPLARRPVRTTARAVSITQSMSPPGTRSDQAVASAGEADSAAYDTLALESMDADPSLERY